MSGRHGLWIFWGYRENELVFVWRGWSFSFFEEEETLTLTSGLCYQWLHVVLPAFRRVKQTRQLTKINPI